MIKQAKQLQNSPTNLKNSEKKEEKLKNNQKL